MLSPDKARFRSMEEEGAGDCRKLFLGFSHFCRADAGTFCAAAFYFTRSTAKLQPKQQPKPGNPTRQAARNVLY